MKISSFNQEIETPQFHTVSDSIISNWITIDLHALHSNLELMKQCIPGGTEILFVVKANAYGHSDVQSVEVAIQSGIRYFGVATLHEAYRLRQQFKHINIVVLDVNFIEDADFIVANDITPIVYTEQMLTALNISAAAQNKKLSVHIKIDTGMGRVGCWYQDAVPFILQALSYEALRIEGICSHFAASESNPVFSETQWVRFKTVADTLRDLGIIFPFYHIANSAGTFYLDLPYFNMVRIGIMAYGIMPRKIMKPLEGLKTVMSWRTKVIYIKQVQAGRSIGYGRTYIASHDTFIATVPIGYADGYIRSLSEKGMVLIRGLRYPIAGRVSMDHIMVDLGPETSIRVGDEVTLIGRDGSASISCEELADLAGTIPYELSCNSGHRAVRYYI